MPWTFYDSQGRALSVGATGATGATGASGSNTIIVGEQDGSPRVTDVTEIKFSGSTITDLTGGVVLVQTSGTSGGAALTVSGSDGTTVANVDKITFSGSGITITDDGSGDVTVTISGSGGGGGVTQAYIGNNVIGGSFETAVGGQMYMVPVTLAEGRTIASISAHIKGNGSNVPSWRAAVLSDNAGTPSRLIAVTLGAATTDYMDTTGRWQAQAIGEYFAAGTYWLAFQAESTVVSIAYDTDTSTTHRTYSVGAYYLKDPALGGNSVSDPDRAYSIRANTIR